LTRSSYFCCAESIPISKVVELSKGFKNLAAEPIERVLALLIAALAIFEPIPFSATFAISGVAFATLLTTCPIFVPPATFFAAELTPSVTSGNPISPAVPYAANICPIEPNPFSAIKCVTGLVLSNASYAFTFLKLSI